MWATTGRWRGIDPIGQATLSLSADGRSLRVAGTIGMGDGERCASCWQALRPANSSGWSSNRPVAAYARPSAWPRPLQQHRHASRAVGTCASACTLVFMAGQPRQLTPGARLGFHRASTGTFNPVFEELANQNLAASYRQAGLARVADRQDPGHAGAQHVVPQGEGPARPGGAIAADPRHRTAAGGQLKPRRLPGCAAHPPVWDALERRQGGTIETAAQRMWAARSAGLADAEVQAAALSPLAQQMPQLIAGADAGLRRRYVQLVTDQLRHCAHRLSAMAARLPRPVGRPTRGPPDAAHALAGA